MALGRIICGEFQARLLGGQIVGDFKYDFRGNKFGKMSSMDLEGTLCRRF